MIHTFIFISDYLLLVAFFIYLIAGGYLLVFKKQTHQKKYAYFILAIASWSLSILLFRFIQNVEVQYRALQMSYVASLFIGIALYSFALHFPEEKKYTPIQRILFYLPAVPFIVFAFSPFFIQTVITTPYGSAAITGKWGLLFFIVLFSFYFYGACIILLKRAKQYKSLVRVQIMYMFIGIFISSIFGILFNFLFTLVGNYAYISVGPFSSIIMIVCIAYAIFRYRLFDIQIRLQQIFNIILPIIVALCVDFIITLLMPKELYAQAHISGPILLLAGIVAYECMRRFLKKTSLGHLFFRKTYAYQIALQQLAKIAPTIIDIEKLAQQILTVLVDTMRIERVAILMRSDAHSNKFEWLAGENYPKNNLNILTDLEDEISAAFHEHENLSYSCNEITHILNGKKIFPKEHRHLTHIHRVCDAVGATLILPLRFQNSLMGFILLGEKFPHKPYTAEDVRLLENVSNQLAVALVNSKLHQDKKILTKLLREEVDRATNKWKQKAKENEELFNVKSQFITVASHQMRTPISVLRNTMQMLLEDYLTASDTEKEEELRQKLQDAAKLVRNSYLAGENLRHTSEMILAASELVGGGASVNMSDIKTKELFDKRIRYAQDLLQAETKENIEFKVALSSDVPEIIQQDKEKLAMILDILVSNAVLYTKSGTITFNVEIEENNLICTVTDTGIGIPEAEQEKLFQQFIRLDNAKKVVPDGTGLGLYLAKQYSQLLGGDIIFESQVHVGSTFTVSIPLKYQYA